MKEYEEEIRKKEEINHSNYEGYYVQNERYLKKKGK